MSTGVPHIGYTYLNLLDSPGLLQIFVTPAVAQLLVFVFTLAYSRISHEYSSLFIIEINLIFLFSL